MRADPAAPPPEGTGACYHHPGPMHGPARHWTRAMAIWLLVYAVACIAALVLTTLAATAHAQVPPEAARYRAELTRAAHAEWGLDAPIAALAAQVHQESGWNPQAVSQVGAAGLAQFMPATARWWCDSNGIGLAQCQPKNPTWALRALVGYDKYLFDRAPTRYTDRDRMHVALRAYNGGLGHWRAEAKASGLPQPTVDQVAAACGLASRHLSHCRENLGYPARILGVLQPRYATWGKSL
jgi:soluble lytic murein transglycosylase-like protein